ncbi:MAG: ATPase [Cellvibrio sp.]|nr:ATPase [Cellvibrio sp.]
MDEIRSLSGFSKNAVLVDIIRNWPAERRDLFIELISLLHNAGVDLWQGRKDRTIRCGSRRVSSKIGDLRLGSIFCTPQKLAFRIDIENTPLKKHEVILVDENHLVKLKESLANWRELYTKSLYYQAEHTQGFWPNDYSMLVQDEPNSEIEDEIDYLAEATSQFKAAPALNQILFGPPGTGKTYSTIDATLEILDPEFLEDYKGEREELKNRFDELVKNQHIRFVTFHQSFSYEDFVEGLSAEAENGQIRYEVKPGVFMQLCEAAVAKVVKQEHAAVDVANRRVWKMSLGNTLGDDAYIFDECIAENKILLGYGSYINFAGCKSREDVYKTFVDNGKDDIASDSYDVTSVTTFVTKMKVGDLVVVSEGNYKFRAIGEITGDYEFLNRDEQDDHYGQARSVRWLRVYSPSLPYEQLLNKSFSQMTIYQLKEPALDRAKLAVLLGNVTEAEDASDNPTPRVLVIDEINRGNISKIFGELITLIEPSKRAGEKEALEVILPYSKKPFSVPANVYIIGTMNTSDRSLAGLDIALRRRFTFKEMPPKPELLDSVEVATINIGALLRVMNQRIEVLLGRDYCLGHAYFMSLNNQSSITDLAAIFQKQIFPLLQEYFFEDWQRIQWVLNDHRKTTNQFVTRQTINDLNDLFGGDVAISDHQLPWVINKDAFVSADSYKGIIKAVNP